MPFRSSGIDEKLRIKVVFCNRINYFELSLPIILNFQDTLLRKKQWVTDAALNGR